MLAKARINCKEAVRLANAFKCVHPECNHQGPIKPYPPFNNKEKDVNSFLMVKSPEELLSEELTCFHTKLRIKETTLGIGVTINRLPRTGEIRMITPTLDLLSMRAFIKQKVRHSLSNERFTHWLPLYFGEEEVYEMKRQIFVGEKGSGGKWETLTEMIDCRERCLHLLKKSMAFISSGSTRKPFKPSMILEILPKLIVTHVADLIQELRHSSILAIRRLVNFVRLFRLLIELHPEIGEEIDGKIKQFIEEPEKRHKDHTGSLGDLLAFATLSQKYKASDILPAYLEEQMDRQVFWMIKEIPELDHTDDKYKDKEVIVEEARSEICFKTGMSGFHITLFFFYLNKMVIETGETKDIDKLCKTLDANWGCLPDKLETLFQKKVFEIQEVKSFYKYYPMLGIPIPNEESLRQRLKQAIENSRKKRYHGNDDNMAQLPTLEEQAKTYLEEKVKPFEFYDEEAKEWLAAESPKW